jgi:hypothetical protein
MLCFDFDYPSPLAIILFHSFENSSVAAMLVRFFGRISLENQHLQDFGNVQLLHPPCIPPNACVPHGPARVRGKPRYLHTLLLFPPPPPIAGFTLEQRVVGKGGGAGSAGSQESEGHGEGRATGKGGGAGAQGDREVKGTGIAR